MMKKPENKTGAAPGGLLSDLRGEGYIKNCLIVMAVLMILSVVLLYAGAISTAENLRTGVREVMDGTLKSRSIIDYSSFDDGGGFSDSDVSSEFFSLFDNYFTGLTRNSDGSYSRIGVDGSLAWSVSCPALTFENSVLCVSFTLSVPLRLAGSRMCDIDIPMRIEREYKGKY